MPSVWAILCMGSIVCIGSSPGTCAMAMFWNVSRILGINTHFTAHGRLVIKWRYFLKSNFVFRSGVRAGRAQCVQYNSKVPDV